MLVSQHGRHRMSDIEITATARSPSGYREHIIARGPYHLYAREHAGEKRAIVFLHGFPDNQHLYDRLVPELARRRVVSSTSSAGEEPTSPSATPTPPPIRPATSTPSSRTFSRIPERLRPPEGIWVFSTPMILALARPETRPR